MDLPGRSEAIRVGEIPAPDLFFFFLSTLSHSQFYDETIIGQFIGILVSDHNSRTPEPYPLLVGPCFPSTIN